MRYSRLTSSCLKAFSHFILHRFVISLTCVCSLIWMPTQDSPCEVLTTVAIVSQHRCESNSKVYWIGTCLSSMHIHIKTDMCHFFMWPLKKYWDRMNTKYATEICGNMVQNCLKPTTHFVPQGPDTWMVPFCWQPDGRANKTL